MVYYNPSSKKPNKNKKAAGKPAAKKPAAKPDLSKTYTKSFLDGFSGTQKYFAKNLGPAYVAKHGREQATKMIKNLSKKPDQRSY